jgi:hypothetical protein
MTLQEIIKSGEEKIADNPNHPHAQVYMAYHAGISKGQSYTGQKWKEKAKHMKELASRSRYEKLISRHIPQWESGDGDLYGSEALEILSFDY